MSKLGLVVAALALAACGGGDGANNEVGQATVNGSVMGASIDANAIAWQGTVGGMSIIQMHETGTACDTTITSGSNLRLQFNCALEPGSYSVVADGSGACPDQILAVFEDGGTALAGGSGGSISLSMAETTLTGSFDIDFGDESLSGSFNLRDCGAVQ